jgi:galactokinase
MAEALRARDMDAYIRLMNESGRSSREKLQNVVPSLHPEQTEMALALDRASELLRGKGAWRIHGGGFAGCIQCLVPAEDYDAFRVKMDACYGSGACFELRVRPCGPHIFGTIV